MKTRIEHDVHVNVLLGALRGAIEEAEEQALDASVGEAAAPLADMLAVAEKLHRLSVSALERARRAYEIAEREGTFQHASGPADSARLAARIDSISAYISACGGRD